MTKQDKIDELQTTAYLKGIDRERERLSHIVQYILSKNVTFNAEDWSEAIDHQGLYKDIGELSSYLIQRVNESKKHENSH